MRELCSSISHPEPISYECTLELMEFIQCHYLIRDRNSFSTPIEFHQELVLSTANYIANYINL